MGQFIGKIDDLVAIVAAIQSDGKRVVYTAGVFDLVQAPQLRALRDAKSRGDFLIVGVHTDASCKDRVEAGRPFATERDRIELVLGLTPVDYVVLADADDSNTERLRPDILALGVDASFSAAADKKAVCAAGGKVFTITVRGLTASRLLKKIQDDAVAAKPSGGAKVKSAAGSTATPSTRVKGTSGKKAAKTASTAAPKAAPAGKKPLKSKSRDDKSRAKKSRASRKPELVGVG